MTEPRDERDKWADDEWHTDSAGNVLGGAPADFVFVAKSRIESAERERDRHQRESFAWEQSAQKASSSLATAEAEVKRLREALRKIADLSGTNDHRRAVIPSIADAALTTTQASDNREEVPHMGSVVIDGNSTLENTELRPDNPTDKERGYCVEHMIKGCERCPETRRNPTNKECRG